MSLLYIGGVRDYLLILVNDTGYIQEQFGIGGLRYFSDYPLLLRTLWTINIVCGLLAPVLLLVASRRALPVAVTAAAAQCVLMVLTFGFYDRWALLGGDIGWFDIGVTLATVAFALIVWRIQPTPSPRPGT